MTQHEEFLLTALWAVRYPQFTGDYSRGLDFGYALGKISMFSMRESSRLADLLSNAKKYADLDMQKLKEAA